MKQADVVNIYSLEHVDFYLVEKWRDCAVIKLLQIMLYPTERKKVLKDEFFQTKDPIWYETQHVCF